MRIYTCVVHAYMYIYIYMHTYIYIYICIYMCICMSVWASNGIDFLEDRPNTWDKHGLALEIGTQDIFMYKMIS